LASGSPPPSDTTATDETALSVIVIAAYPSVRAGLRALAESTPGVRVSAAVASDDLDTPWTPDAFIIDVDPDDSGLPARIAARFPRAGLLLLLDAPNMYRRLGLRAERDGPAAASDADVAPGHAALLKDAGAAEIGAALAAVRQGLVVLDPQIARQAAPQPAAYAVDDTSDEPLTERERQVLELLALGLPNKTIARELGISEHTAKFHVGTLMSKLGAASRTEAVAIAARRGVLVL
jgi:DNA-binding NarL/FixJ family response regulator